MSLRMRALFDNGHTDGKVDCNEEGDGIEEDDPRSRKGDLEDALQRSIRRFCWRLYILIAWNLSLANAAGFVRENL